VADTRTTDVVGSLTDVVAHSIKEVPMKRIVFVVAFAALVLPVRAQERIPADKAEEIARLLSDHVAKLNDLQLKTQIDVTKPYGLLAGDRGVMVIPETKLSAGALKNTGKDIIPLGQLWFHKVAPAKDGKVVAEDQLRFETVNADGKDHKLVFCILGVRKSDGGDLELVVYAKGKEPILKAAITKSDARVDLPIELEAKKDTDDTATLTLNILGSHRASIAVAKLDD